MAEEMLTLPKFEEASEIVKKVTQETKLVYSKYFSEQTGNKVYLKPENMQLTGAYKLRGAYYKISTLSEEERAKGLITASAGNHAQGVAYAAKCYGAKAVIVMPTTTPLIKVERTQSYGAEVVLYGDVYDEACAKAYELAAEHGYTFIHPFDDLTVATGQGTIAMEVIQELPLVDYILVPIGGGGLATGVSTLAKLLKPNIKVIGVEPSGAACMKASFEKGEVTTVSPVSTIADGTAVQTPGTKIFPYVRQNLDEIIRTGTPMHADVIPEMLGTIFYEGTPLHDGAVVIRDGVIVAAGCVLPLSNNLDMGKDMGTRHRAGLGMSENSDAIVVVVSEETGIISLAKNGVLIRRLDRQNLFNLLQEEVVPPEETEEDNESVLKKLLRKGGNAPHAKAE